MKSQSITGRRQTQMIPVNNGFNPYANQLENFNQQSTQQSGQGVISITGGEETALNYPLNPNSTALLISTDTKEMFMKGVDANGITNIFKAFDITEKMPKYQTKYMEQNLNENYVTKDDFNKLSNEIRELRKFFDDLSKPVEKG